MDEIKETAYLREYRTTNQCELLFNLTVQLAELATLGVLSEEVRAVQQITATVESLLQHIVNKIKKSMKTKLEKQEQSTDLANEITINVALTDSTTKQPIKPKMVLQTLFTSNMRRLEFSIFNCQYIVVINAPCVKEIKLPPIVYSNFTVQPIFHCIFTENSMSEFSWHKSKDRLKWTEVAIGFRYKVIDDDLDHYLKVVCTPGNSTLTGPAAEAISENTVQNIGVLPNCPFENRHKFTAEALKDNNFRVVSYNVLSCKYAEGTQQMPYCPERALAIDYRKQLVMKELLGYQADIICLQEVDNSIYNTYYRNIFKENGYRSYYHKKGNRSTEGLACFFNKSRFKKVEDHQIIYSNEIKSNKLFSHLLKWLKRNKKLQDVFMMQITSLQITTLKVTSVNRYVIVANTHLFYRPDAELVRLLQVHIATTYLNSIVEYYAKNSDAQVDVIFCGDFNCVPTSGVYAYMINGKINEDCELQKVKNIDLSHKFQFESACGQTKYTNYTDDFKDCLDYIFIEAKKIKVNNVIQFPTEEELALYEGLPNEVYPSDHLALVVDLCFI